jgi:nucleoside 2-deoxyribosyltransferase
MRTVYLAGPILDCTHGEANNWRFNMIGDLEPHGIIGVSPLRCEPLIGERYSLQYADPRFGTARAISSKNRLDVRMSDMTLCYFPAGFSFSKGTCVELAWANAYNKPTILVSDVPEVTDHPVLQACADWILPTLDEALDVITGVLSIYTRKPLP